MSDSKVLPMKKSNVVLGVFEEELKDVKPGCLGFVKPGKVQVQGEQLELPLEENEIPDDAG